MFFASPGKYPSSGMYSIAHFVFLAIMVVAISLSLVLLLKYKKNKARKVVGIIGIVFLVLEVFKIWFVLSNVGVEQINSWVPLYFCSIFIFMAVLSGFAKGFVRKVGDSFVFAGGIFGGLAFLLYPSTSITNYYWFHFITFHSFLLHSSMVLSGLLIVMSGQYKPKFKDVFAYSTSVLLFTVLAFFVNHFHGSNLMFISQKFAGVFLLDPMWEALGQPLYCIVITIVQAFVMFLLATGIYKLLTKFKKSNKIKYDVSEYENHQENKELV